MKMSVREQLLYWGLGLGFLVMMLWLLSDALLPFVLGAALAYFTDPLANWLEKKGLGRVTATVVITLLLVAAVLVALGLIVPVLAGQIRDLIERAPALVDDARAAAAHWLPGVDREGSFLNRAVSALRDNAQSLSVSLLKKVWSGGIALVNFISVVVVTPVVAFYLLMDWNRMVAAIDGMLPRDHRDTIHQLARDLDDVLSGFVRGQLTVCLILGTFYGVALSLVGLNFGLLIGLIAGLISFIPFVGSIVGGILSLGVAAAQYWQDPVWIAVVAVIFVVGQAVEGNFLTPKLVGDKVGLHPVWLLFALSAFGSLFGFVGLLVAVPAAAAIGVIGRFLIDRYKDGRLYRGAPPADRDADAE